MLARLGFVASVLSEDISTSRTCRLRNATRLRIRELIAENLTTLERVITFLERHQILLYRITPKVHLSSQASNGPRGAHAEYIDVADALAFFEIVPLGRFDCMLEAKQKDRALLKLRAALRRNADHDS